MAEFNLADQVRKLQNSDKRSFPPVERPSDELNTVIDRLAVSPEQVDADEETLESLIDLCHGFPHLSIKLQTQLCYLVASSMGNLAHDIGSNLTGSSNSNAEVMEFLPQYKRHLEEYGYLTHVLLSFLQEDVHIAASQAVTLGRGGSKKVKTSGPAAELFKRSCNQIESTAEAVIKVLELNLSRIFQTTPEKDLFVGLFTKPIFSLLEVEAAVKVTSLKLLTQRIIAMAVKYQNQGSSVQNSIMTSLTYFLHLSNFNAELLKSLNDDFDYPQLTEEILREISSRVFNAKDTTGPKAISSFLTKLSELSPQIMLRQMSLVVRLLNNSSITLRCSVVETFGNIVTRLAQDDQACEHYKQQIEVLLELLEERFQDSNPYVRTKAIQGCLKICDLESKFNKNKSNFTKLAFRSLQDRSSLVRRNAVKLLSKLLLTHPFKAIHGTQLHLGDWEKYLKSAKANLAKYLEKNSSETPLETVIETSLREETEHSSQDHEISDEAEVLRNEAESESTNAADTEIVLRLKLMVVYYSDAVEFIKIINKSLRQAAALLFSKNRNEVLETMDYLVLADAYGLEPSKIGIKRMLHLVWMKGTNDEGKSISSHLIGCYTQLFLTAPDGFNFREKAAFIAKNLIKLTSGASLADLASLEQLLGMMYKDKLIEENVVNVLWAIYNSILKDDGGMEHFDRQQVHGSVIVLGMLAAANHEITLRGLDSLLNVGLGKPGDEDLILCKYSCLALGRMIPRNSPNLSIMSGVREDEVVKKLYAKIINYTKDAEWYPVCEQALNALFVISSQADIVATELIREKTMMTFGKSEEDDSTILQHASRVTSLSQLLFIVGQTAVKSLVYLEKCEAEFKRAKIESETRQGREKGQQDDDQDENSEEGKEKELEMIGGTNEDDFADAIVFIKENELLFGENSLMSKFCPIVEEICSNTSRFNDPMLQRVAALCLEKFMCVSSKYCERRLSLLITMMEKSDDPIIRSNAVLGLGDMAVCFNNLVDENTDYLYRRLHDKNLTVQRTCLMTVTFLILAGQVKVKGQLGQMAKCLENPDQGISDMCRLFFTELATKDNAVYNGFIDIFSNLSNDEDLNKDSFKRIIRFLLSFIEKERHQKQLVEKLLGRLPKCETAKQWSDVAFVLNSIPYKDERVAEVLEKGFKMVSARD